jgi:hypothetical protein
MERWKAEMPEGQFKACRTLTFKQAETWAAKHSTCASFAHWTRNKRRISNSASVFAIVYAAGPGCASLGYTQSILAIGRSLILTIVRRRLPVVTNAVKQQLTQHVFPRLLSMGYRRHRLDADTKHGPEAAWPLAASCGLTSITHPRSTCMWRSGQTGYGWL